MAKVILTGVTGYAGAFVLEHCLASAQVDKIVVLTRSPLPAQYNNNPKIDTIVHKDFLSYPPEVLQRCKGAVACLWALGLRGAPFGYSDLALANKIDVDYPYAAAEAFVSALAGDTPSQVPFRFVLLSGRGSELDQTKKPLMLRDTCLLKGRIEAKLHDLEASSKNFEVYTCRPLGIIQPKPPIMKWLVFSLLPSVQATDLAASMLDIGLHGHDGWILECADITAVGRRAA